MELSQGLGIQVEEAGDDEVEHDEGGGYKNQKSEPGVFPNPHDVQTGHSPDDGQYGDYRGQLGEGEKGGGVGHRADRGDAGSEDVVHHDGGHRHKGDQGAQDQVGKGVNPAPDEL